MATSISMPSLYEINSAAKAFDQEDRADTALVNLFGWATGNTDYNKVLLKVVALNQLYSTNVYAVREMAAHISEAGSVIDDCLAVGCPSVVERIASLTLNGVTRIHFSFATKYCSFHQTEKYPIYDANVYRTLMALAKGEKRRSCVSKADRTYKAFREEIDALRTRLCEPNLSYKTLDKYLYRTGRTLKKNSARAAIASKTAS
ncbi:hypothetical protein SAMN05421819_2517 [Bryocella elongata]|uniref:Uncharacterized protein n=1 Tax=Bryocella elongata TaxID=863522 RepID=A0A1H5ZAH0_9BACT|nr:hypothetical protein [Bryocella elongata]SEG32637.1 hypothetical protein SAMN05421819_2517 [Bryocella elongata]